MKKTILALAILMTACSTPVVTFTEAKLDYKAGENIDVKLSYPVAISENTAAADSINTAIIAGITSIDTPTIESIIEAAKESERDSIPYGNYSEWSGYKNNAFTSIYIENYVFTGGAHGNTIASTLTFDNKTGYRVDIKAHIKDTVAFRNLFIESYIAEYGYEINTSAAEIGYFIDLKDLSIPNFLMLTDKGIAGYYQQYEIACYAVGITSATVPYDKLTDIIKIETKDMQPIEITK